MLSYEQLDCIADAYIPLLGLISITVIVYELRKEQVRDKLFRFSKLLLSIATAYGIFFLDNTLKAWPSLGLDYSTHTAIALVFVVHLSYRAITILQWATWASFLTYALLILYQHYHTLADILSTSAVIIPLLFLIQSKWVKLSFTTKDDNHKIIRE